MLVGWAVAVAGTHSLHQLTRRWVVLVPTGLVIHDAFTMPEPQLILRTMITRLGPALIDTDSDDLTGPILPHPSDAGPRAPLRTPERERELAIF